MFCLKRFIAGLCCATLLAGVGLSGCHPAAKQETGDTSGSTATTAQEPLSLLSPPVTDPAQPLARIRGTQAGNMGTKAPADFSPFARMSDLLTSLNLTAKDAVAPTDSGAGILICEPVTSTKDNDFAAFGVGCARWLHFTVGGQGALGKTPLWAALYRVQSERKRTNLRLTPDETAKLDTMIGITHAATGELQGDAKKATLTYRLWELPVRKAVGSPFTATGTPTQIIAALPEMARQMALSLHVAKPHIPSRVGANVAELQGLGSLPLLPGETLTAEQSKGLRVLAPRVPLAGMMRLHSGDWQDTPTADTLIKTMIAQEPENQLIYGVIGWRIPNRLSLVAGPFAQVRKKFPYSYILAHTNVWYQRGTGDLLEEGRAAKMAVRNAPKNPDAWLTLGATLEDRANVVRQGRYSRDMTPEMQTFVEQVYADWLTAGTQATKLDPDYAKAWARVAQAATFSGDRQTANQAIWNALKADRQSPEALEWAMEMFQQKWGGNPADLVRATTFAAEQNYGFIGQTIGVYNALVECGHKDKARAMLERLVPLYQTAAEQAPNDAQAQYNLGAILTCQHHNTLALKQYEKVVKLRPNDPEAHFDLAQSLGKTERVADTIREYHETLRLAPSHREALGALGQCLMGGEKYAEAEKPLRQWLKLSPANMQANALLGEALCKQKKYKEAVPVLMTAARLYPYNIDTLYGLCLALAETGQAPQAIRAGEQARKLMTMMGRKDPAAYCLLAYAYAKNKQSQEALNWTRKAAEIAPDDAMTHASIGDVLVEIGRKEAAQKEWQTALKSDPNGPGGKEAREMLAKYPAQ